LHANTQAVRYPFARNAVRPLRLAAHAARRLWADSPAERKLLAEAVLALAAARLKHATIPFDRLVKEFGTRQPLMQAPPPEEPMTAEPVPDSHRLHIETVGRAVTRAARYVPFRAVCLQQAMAAQAMLEQRHIESQMHFGIVRKPDGTLAAHAWLSAGPLEVTGFPLDPSLVEMTRFSPGRPSKKDRSH